MVARGTRTLPEPGLEGLVARGVPLGTAAALGEVRQRPRTGTPSKGGLRSLERGRSRRSRFRPGEAGTEDEGEVREPQRAASPFVLDPVAS